MKTWCEPLNMPSGKVIYGGAARNVRIANFGGMPAILTRVFEEASALARPERKKMADVIPLKQKSRRAA